MTNALQLWQPEEIKIASADAKSATSLLPYALQLSDKDKKQISKAYNSDSFEMGLNYLWQKTLSVLKKQLATVGIGLLAEMLGRTDINEDDVVDDFLSPRDAIRLAKELGIISETDAIRLRQTSEIVNHFTQMDTYEGEQEEILETEAITHLLYCTKSVLARPDIEVAADFVQFRKTIETSLLDTDHPYVTALQVSPYFFLRLTVNVLTTGSKTQSGAKLEHILANTNTIIPIVWQKLKDPERWQLGAAYSEVYSEGRKTALAGLKSVLMKINGFDYVPETIRSNTFIAAANEVIMAHEGFNNFYNEPSPVRNLAKLGTTIPSPAIAICLTALLCVVLGNRYGVSTAAELEARKLLKNVTPDRWGYYLNQVLQNDLKILYKLTDENILSRWIKISSELGLTTLDSNNDKISRLIRATAESNKPKIVKFAQKLIADYYGSKK